MAHIHPVTDSDTYFVIDPISRSMSNTTSRKISLIKGDHNSEVFTFELPKMVEGHDMSTCNRVEIHYLNIDSKTRARYEDVYVITDHEGAFGVDPDHQDKVIATWLLSRNVTTYAGSLNFIVRYACISEDPVVDYDWHTAIFSGITVQDCIQNSEAVVSEYSDVLDEWYEKFLRANDGNIDLNSREAVKFWVGTNDEYETEVDTPINNCLYIITDDGTLQEVETRLDTAEADIDELQGNVAALEAADQVLSNRLDDVENETSVIGTSAVRDIVDGTTPVGNALNVTNTINGILISNMFNSSGLAKKALGDGNGISISNNYLRTETASISNAGLQIHPLISPSTYPLQYHDGNTLPTDRDGVYLVVFKIENANYNPQTRRVFATLFICCDGQCANCDFDANYTVDIYPSTEDHLWWINGASLPEGNEGDITKIVSFKKIINL